MADFYAGIPNEVSLQLQLIHAQLTNLKVRRRDLIEPFGTLSADDFLEMVTSGEIDKEAVGDAYQAVISINAEIEVLREEAMKIMKGKG